MSNLKYIIKKSEETIKNEGLVSFSKKTINYIKQHVKNENKQQVKDILFINGCYLPHPSRYRVIHQVEQLSSNNMSVDFIDFEKLTIDKEKYYRAFVFYRCPITNTIEEFIKKAKYNNKTVFYDIDDLVFDTKYTDDIDYIKKMSKDEKKIYDDGVIRMGKTLKLCDYAITTTEALATELKKYVKDVFINRNVASERMLELSLKTNKRNDDKIIIGYLSGSITHNPDFEMIKPALIKLLEEYNNVYLKIVGILDIPDDLKKYSEKILTAPFVDYTELPSIISSLDINLAPIEDTLFNRAKSENKWMEASLVKTVTIASNVGAFKVIKNNIDGLLVDNDEESWYKGLKKLIDNKELREKLAENANKRCIDEYVSTYSGLPLTNFIKSKLNTSIAFVLPTTNVSGGVNVVTTHANILRKQGFDVFIINMDKKDNNIINKDGELEVISETNNDIICHLDKIVATLWSTLYYCNEYPYAKKTYYLVQGFETNLVPYGNYLKQLINSTYSFDNVNYLTVSKWCQKWLKEKYNIEAKYIPNGIDLDRFPTTKRNFNKKIRILVEGNSDDYYKNVDESFKIVEKLDKNKFEIKYLSYQGNPKKWYHVDEFLHKVPYDEVGSIYNSADMLIKSSVLESFSYPPLEMMATGGIVIVAPNDGNLEYLEHNINCLLYEPGNINDAVEKINTIINDTTLRNNIIKNGLKTAKERDWNNIIDKIIDAYK